MTRADTAVVAILDRWLASVQNPDGGNCDSAIASD